MLKACASLHLGEEISSLAVQDQQGPSEVFSEDGMSFIQCNMEGKVLQKTGNTEPLVHNKVCISVKVLYNAVVQQV